MPIKTTKDGRTIRTGQDYSFFRQQVWMLQVGKCMCCPRKTRLELDIDSDYSFHLSHVGSRGMGSAFRDDVLGTKKGQVEGGKCGACHREEHHQGRNQPFVH